MPVSQPPTNPKKQALMPSTPLRRRLRGAGHALTANVLLGQQGTSAGVLKQIQQGLADHELIKIKLGSECPQSRFEVADLLAAEPGVQVAQILGRTLLIYKRDPEAARFE
jgi:RNA-binding protein